MKNSIKILYLRTRPYLRKLRVGLIVIGLIILLSEGAGYDLLSLLGVQSVRVFGLKIDFLTEAALMVSEIRGKIKLPSLLSSPLFCRPLL